jgi:hypothetical protein
MLFTRILLTTNIMGIEHLTEQEVEKFRAHCERAARRKARPRPVIVQRQTPEPDISGRGRQSVSCPHTGGVSLSYAVFLRRRPFGF